MLMKTNKLPSDTAAIAENVPPKYLTVHPGLEYSNLLT